MMKSLVAISFLGMVTVNALANILPINGQSTGEVSDKFGNLFAPAGYTFSIWGFIYILLASYTLYQFGLFQKSGFSQKLLTKIGVYFIISSIANIAWILCWHYEKIGFSLIMMIIILLCLLKINQHIFIATLTQREKLFVRLPFSIYFGWITIATIANVTTYLVSIGWSGFGISEQIWVILILLVGVIIGSLTMLRYQDMAYGLVVVWAYIGILVKHNSASGFHNEFPTVIFMIASCLLFLVIELFYLLITLVSERRMSEL